MKNLRHVVNVMRPTKNRASLGQEQGSDEVIQSQWRCEVKSLTGRELEVARSKYADATLSVSGIGPFSKRPKPTDYCEFRDGVYKEDEPRKLHIGFVDDEKQNGIKLTFLCGEQIK